MADDLSQLESSLAGIERLTQRLVVLFEFSLKDQLTALNENVGAASKSATGAAVVAKDVDKNIAATGDKLQKLEVATSKANESSDKLQKQSIGFYKSFNQFVDGSRQLEADTRQALSTFSSIATSFMNGFSKLESSSAQAAAASKGILTTTQVAGKLVSNASSAARNIMQFGIGVGGVLSVFESMVDFITTTRKKMEVEVANARTRADILFNADIARRKALETGVSGAQIELDALKTLKANRAKAESDLQRRLKEREDSATYKYENTPDGYLVTRRVYAPGTITDDEAKRIRIDNNLNEAEKTKLDNRIAELTETVKIENDRAESLRSLKEREAALATELFKAKLGNTTRNYVAEEQLLKAELEKRSSMLGGNNDEAVFSSMLDLTKQLQQVGVDRLEQELEEAILDLNKNKPIKDDEGNTLADLMLQKEKSIVLHYFELLEKLQTGLPADVDKLKVTAEQKLAFSNAATDINAPVSSALTKNQAKRTALDQQTSAAAIEAQANEFKKASRDADARLSRNTALAQEGLYYDAIDPMAAVDIKAREVQGKIDFLEQQRRTALGDNAANIDAELTSLKQALEVINETDRVLATRARASIKRQKDVEQLMRDIDNAALRGDVNAITLNEALNRRKRQLNSSKTEPGAGGLLDIEMQDAEFARKKNIAAQTRAMYEEQLQLAIAENAEASVILDLRAKAFEAQKNYANIISAQILATANQAAMLEYQLTDDKATFDRFNRARRLGNRTPAWMQNFTGQTDYGDGLGSESARLTRDFNESFRRRFGKLTPEEKAAAKEERSLNNQLERARRAVASGGGTRKQRELVEHYDRQKSATPEDKLAVLVAQGEEANRLLAKMAGDPGQIKATK